MPRYFFNMVEGHGKNVVRDCEGTPLPGVRAARKEAIGLARDVAGHGLRELTQAWQVVVTDERGDHVLTIALCEIRTARLRSWLGLGSRLTRLGSGFAHRILVVVLAGAVLAALVGLNATTVVKEPDGGYQTAAAPTDGAVIAVRFAASARVAEVTELLATYKASIVDGPRTGGFYRLRVADAPSTQEGLAEIAGRMSREPIVELAAVAQ
jgi:hypothetical protein